MRKKTKKASAAGAGGTSSKSFPNAPQLCFEGEALDSFLKQIKSDLESARDSDPSLPRKFWIKQRFAIGVNEVTRCLERMSPLNDSGKPSKANLQAVVVASDCDPRWLTKHLPGLAASRNVPVIAVKDGKKGSLRLGEVFNLKTAIAIGIKEDGNAVNRLIKGLFIGTNSVRLLCFPWIKPSRSAEYLRTQQRHRNA